MEYKYKMKEGEKLGRSPNSPAIFIIGEGKDTYLWVGNDAKDDMACFGTISNLADLRRIARSITKALSHR